MIDDALTRLISDAITKSDPLDPWLVQSNWDDHYWDDVAAAVAAEVACATSQGEVQDALSAALSEVIPKSAHGAYARDRIAAAARDIWNNMASQRLVPNHEQSGEPMTADLVWASLEVLASRLSDLGEASSFEVRAGRRTSVLRWQVVEGIEVTNRWTDVFEPVRRRSLFKSGWSEVQPVHEAASRIELFLRERPDLN